MWRPWAKSPVKIHDTSSPFSCSSFKDIQHLCTEDPAPNRTSASSRKASIFHRVRLANTLIRSWAPRVSEPRPDPVPEPNDSSTLYNKTPLQLQQPSISIPGADKRIVVYFTSLRVVRSTFEDCRSVRSILRGFRVQLDERDLSMDSRFLNELQGILGGQSKLTLPRVFIGGRYIGGAEEVRQLNETGELKKFVEGLPAAEPGVCNGCGGYRFVLCNECDGSHKLYTEKAGGFKSCTVCNENGLIRCPSCSYGPL
ncbi:putative Glutaredoxin family protein [Melia azedarach]|uniref:Glutaredoxin family protein n=1 Tax=Melia azedarach TaxID=155640 RepID=A0ACC1YPA3_MELAZ|nr:putative Glutaredoxin family protein [Melia azedarach]